MTISQVGAATGTTTATVPAHAIGDLIIIFAYRSGSTTAPSLPAGYTSILTKAGTTCSARIGFKIATATNDASGTWTNASHLTCLVYRSSNYANGSSLFVGGSASSSSTNTTVNYPALTMTHTDGTSWAIGFAGTSVATAALSTHAPAGMTFFTGSDVTATTEVCAFDTNGTVSSWSSTNTTVSASGNSVSATVELIENAAGTSINNFVQHWSLPYQIHNQDPNSTDHFVYNIDPTLAGNGLVVVVNYPSGATPTITDDKGNSWPASGTVGSTVTADAGAGNMALQAFILTSATTGTSQIIVDFGGSPQPLVKTWITQLYNITGTLNGSSHAAAVNSIGIVSPGSFTPTNNNANGGNLILAYTADSNQLPSSTPARIVPETGYSLNDADSSNNSTTNGANASQFWLQATSAATVPRFYMNAAAATDTFNVIAFALSVGSQGTPKPSGAGVAPWVDRVCYFGSEATSNPWLLQIPSTGNFGLLMSFLNGSGVQTSSSATDSDGTSWTKQTFTPAAQTPYYNANQTPKSNRTLSVQIGLTGNLQAVYYDISNAATTSPVVASASGTNTSAANTNSLAHQPDITPTATNQLTVACFINGFGPTIGVTSPTGVIFDSPFDYVAKIVGSISGTTLTVASTTWGTVSINSEVLVGTGVAVGTSVQAGTNPTFTIQPSQTVSAGTTMLQTDGDSGINFGNGFAHYFNGGSTSAQNWTWSMSNNPNGGGAGCAIIIAGPPAAASNFGWYSRTQDDRTLPVSRLPDQGAPWFRASQLPPPSQWLPTTGEEDRPPNPNRRPDDSSIENRRWFVRSPVPVPTSWQPTTGQEDRPPNPNRIPAPDQPFPWFVRSPVVVPTIRLPTTGQEDRPPPIKRPPDEPNGFFFKPVAVQTTPTTLLPTTGQEDRPPNPNRIPAPDQPFPWFRPSVVPLPTAFPPTTGQEDRPPPPRLRPDNSSIENRQWFVKSPLPVPMVWVPTTGQEDRPPPQPQSPEFPKPVRAFFQIPPPITLASLNVPRYRQKLISQDVDQYSSGWFLPSPSPVPPIWLPTAGEQNYPPPIARSPDEPVPFFFKFVPPVGVAGMAWWRPIEVYLEPPPMYRDYKPAWNPQFIVQIAPPKPTAVYANPFVATPGQMTAIPGDPPS